MDDRPVYAEMLLPDGYCGKVFRGFSWVNLSITASGWEGRDKSLYDRTIDTYTGRASFTWHGHRLLSMEYTEGRESPRSCIGKCIAWEILYFAVFVLSDYGDGRAIGVPLEKKQMMLEAFRSYDPWKKR